MYRIFGDNDTNNFIPAEERGRLTGLTLSEIGGSKFALTSDTMGGRNGQGNFPNAAWSHISSWGTVVAYADGRAEFLKATRHIALITLPSNLSEANEYCWRMFRAFDKNDFTDVTTRWPP